MPLPNEVRVTMEEPYLSSAVIMTSFKNKGWGTPMPMLTIPFIDWFNFYDFSTWTFVEFGSGNSTNFFAKRTSKVTSFETDMEFFNNLKLTVEKNVRYSHLSQYDMETGNFKLNIEKNTLVLIDAACNRNLLTTHVLSKGFPDILILDNSEVYPLTRKNLINNNYMELLFYGFRFHEYQEGCTSVFFRQGAIPQPTIPFNGLVNMWDQPEAIGYKHEQ